MVKRKRLKKIIEKYDQLDQKNKIKLSNLKKHIEEIEKKVK